MNEDVKFVENEEATEEVVDEKEQLRKEKQGEVAWFVVNCYSTHERKVADNLKRRVVSMGIEDLVFSIIVAEQEVAVMKDGVDTGKKRMKNLYPGYVFVEMIMTDYAWYVVRNTPGVTGFVGSSGKGTNVNKSNQFLREWALSVNPCTIDTLLVIMSALSMVLLKEQKEQFFPSIRTPESSKLKPSSSDVPPKQKSNSLKSKRSKRWILKNELNNQPVFLCFVF